MLTVEDSGTKARPNLAVSGQLFAGCPTSYPWPSPALLYDLIFGGEVCPARPLANPHQHINSKEISAGIDCSHVADQLRNLWFNSRRMILSGYQDISIQSFTNLAVARPLRVRCGPMWADVAGHAPMSGRDLAKFGVKNPHPFYAL